MSLMCTEGNMENYQTILIYMRLKSTPKTDKSAHCLLLKPTQLFRAVIFVDCSASSFQLFLTVLLLCLPHWNEWFQGQEMKFYLAYDWQSLEKNNVMQVKIPSQNGVLDSLLCLPSIIVTVFEELLQNQDLYVYSYHMACEMQFELQQIQIKIVL